MKALNDYIVVKPIEEERKIAMAEVKNKSNKGEVLSVGDEVENITEGDEVYFSPRHILDEVEDKLIINYKSIYGKK